MAWPDFHFWVNYSFKCLSSLQLVEFELSMFFNIYRLEKFILIVIAKIFSFVPYAIIILVHYGHLYLNEFE